MSDTCSPVNKLKIVEKGNKNRVNTDNNITFSVKSCRISQTTVQQMNPASKLRNFKQLR